MRDFGKLNMKNIGIFEGKFENDRIESRGKFIDKDGNVYKTLEEEATQFIQIPESRVSLISSMTSEDKSPRIRKPTIKKEAGSFLRGNLNG
jgi:hypothetical protein